MPRTKYEFIKLELRLFNDYRFFSLNEFERLLYIYLIAFAKQTKNKIPKTQGISAMTQGVSVATQGISATTQGVLATYLRTSRSEAEIESAIKRIKKVFPKLKETKYFYYFAGWKERYHNTSLNGSVIGGQTIDIDIDNRQKTIDIDIDNKTQFLLGVNIIFDTWLSNQFLMKYPETKTGFPISPVPRILSFLFKRYKPEDISRAIILFGFMVEKAIKENLFKVNKTRSLVEFLRFEVDKFMVPQPEKTEHDPAYSDVLRIFVLYKLREIESDDLARLYNEWKNKVLG